MREVRIAFGVFRCVFFSVQVAQFSMQSRKAAWRASNSYLELMLTVLAASSLRQVENSVAKIEKTYKQVGGESEGTWHWKWKRQTYDDDSNMSSFGSFSTDTSWSFMQS